MSLDPQETHASVPVAPRGKLSVADIDTTMSKKGFAEHLRVTPGRVSQYIAAGLPVEENGRIHIERGKAWVKANVDPNRRRAGGDGTLPLFGSSSRDARETAEAEIAQLKAKQLGGQLIDRAATLRTIESRARAERDAWIGWVNRAAPELAHEAGGNLSTTVAVLDRLVRDQLVTLAKMPLGEIDHHGD